MPASIPPAAAPAAQIAVVSEDWAAVDHRPPAPAPTTPKMEAASARVPVPAETLINQRIKDAVAKTITAAPDTFSVAPNQQAGLRSEVLSADKYATFTKQFAHAKVPDCFGGDALKVQPPQIGPIVFTGLLAIPFLVVAAARCKCK